jgi:hypothetical protein
MPAGSRRYKGGGELFGDEEFGEAEFVVEGG